METDILVIGGGATGAGVAWDAALRGFRVVLVERRDLTHGTTGRYHGLLHSGGRYAVTDPHGARECIAENRILRRTHAHCIEACGGFFVVTPEDEGEYPDRFQAACRQAGIPCQEIPLAQALRREPLLNRRLSRVFELPDGSADSFLATHATVQAARQAGAQILTYHEVIDLRLNGGDGNRRVMGAIVRNQLNDANVTINAALTINATGAWAGQIAALAGIEVIILASKGTMVALNHRVVNTVINRCQSPADGDIIVPSHTVAVIGTTAVTVNHPEQLRIETWEVAKLLAEADKMVPGFSQARLLRAWAGVRPLFQETYAGAGGRDITRKLTLLDHQEREGVAGLLTITGGKWTTFRLMAEATVDRACDYLGGPRPCRTAATPVPGAEQGPYWLGHRLREVEEDRLQGALICECELVTRAMLENAARNNPTVTLDDLRRDVRLGKGPCQGGFCTYRAVGILHEMGQWQSVTADAPWTVAHLQAPGQQVNSQQLRDEGRTTKDEGRTTKDEGRTTNDEGRTTKDEGRTTRDEGRTTKDEGRTTKDEGRTTNSPLENRKSKIENPNLLLRDFLQERWKGVAPILWGRQLQQERLDELIYLSLLNADHLPDRELRSPLTDFYHQDTRPGGVNSQQSTVNSQRRKDEGRRTKDELATRTLATRALAPRNSQLLVIGAGLSGLTAAYTAARLGLEVEVIAKGWGAHHWGAGTIDLLGYAPGNPGVAVTRPWEIVAALDNDRPGHPYSLLGAERLAEKLDAFAALTAEIGLPYRGAAQAGDNLWLPSALGAARPCYLAPLGQLAGDLSRPEPLLIVGFQGLRDFFPHLIAENLARQGHKARAAQLPLALLTGRRDFTPVHLAEGLADRRRLAALAEALNQRLRPGERIGLPAILGIDDHPALLAELERLTGAAVFEIPTLPPSVPGLRLFRALRRRLQALGARVSAGMAVNGIWTAENGDGRFIQWVTSESSARPLKHRADYFLLATGGILGGGFDSDSRGRVWETILDLPLTGPQQRRQWFDSRFLSRAGHPVFAGGVTVNNQFQPVDARGRPGYANLWAAGNLLAHSDPIQERSLEGTAVATGMAAAEMIGQLVTGN